MADAKHTPGPWTVGDDCIYGTSHEGEHIMVVYELGTNAADASLIAAAPELLAAAEEALGALNGAECALPGYVVAALERAIAKATGSAA